MEGKKVTTELWLGMARDLKPKAEEKGLIKKVTVAGAKMAFDTCHVVAPIKGRFLSVATNSAKGVFYGRGRHKFKTLFGTMEKCLEWATKERKQAEVERERFDYIIILDAAVYEILKYRYPTLLDRLILWDIADPFGQSREAYERTADKIRNLIQKKLVPNV